ncbi:polymer-forming cytoskeletal protein [Chloroflexia bacterium SDU3-3]|nr:polymer-forming cytoskeletal protein [Chloroflexia bacterium SDU3-3]
MFGRRTTDSPLPAAPASPTEDDSVDLDILPDLPDMLLASKPAERAPQGEPASFQPNIPTPSVFVPTMPSGPAPFSLSGTASVAQPSPAPAPAPTSTFSTSVPTSFAAAPAPTPAPAAMRPKSGVESVIGPEDFFDGNYRSERGVRLQGTARGSIESRQYIFVEAGANVEASLSAEEITIAGEFHGTIECRKRLEIMGTGRVHGQVTTAMLVVQEGGVLDGELHMRSEQSA